MSFTGILNHNQAIAALFNMIINQKTFADNIANTFSSLADAAKVEGGLYGDTSLFHASDVLKTYEWLGDAEAQNLLKLHRPTQPKTQAITVDQFRMIPLTVDNYLTKRAFMNEGSFAAFNSQMLAWLRETQRVYVSTMYNTFIGTHQAGLSDDGKGAKQNVTIALPAEPDSTNVETEAYNRLRAQAFAKSWADLLVNLTDATRDYNDYGFLRSYNLDDLVFVSNADFVNEVTKLDTPMIFNGQNLIDKLTQNVRPARYFGNINSNAGTTSATNTTIRSLIQKDYNTVEPSDAAYDPSKHIFFGDLLPASTAYQANETYTQDSTIMFKIYHKNGVPLQSGFEVSTDWFNPRSLTQTHYLIFSYNKLTHLKNYPFITVKGTIAA